MRTAILTLTLASAVAFADKSNPTEPEIQTIIKSFAGKEAEFAKARENYTYRQTAVVREFDGNSNAAGGKYEVVSDIVFSLDGKRNERIVRAPVPTPARAGP